MATELEAPETPLKPFLTWVLVPFLASIWAVPLFLWGEAQQRGFPWKGTPKGGMFFWPPFRSTGKGAPSHKKRSKTNLGIKNDLRET